MLMYLMKDMGDKVQLVPGEFAQQGYGFGINEKEGNLRKLINLSLLSLTENKLLDELNTKYFAPPSQAN